MELSFDKRIYPTEAILQATSLCDPFQGCEVALQGNFTIVRWQPSAALSAEERRSIVARLREEAAVQVLRLKLAKENRKSREMLIHQALSASLPAPAQTPPAEEPISEEEIDKELDQILKEVDTEGRDYKEDPLGIAVPWEERNAATHAPDKPSPPHLDRNKSDAKGG